MTSLFCPKCSIAREMNVSTLKREETGPDGKPRTVLTTSFHCAICFSFVRSEDQIDDGKNAERSSNAGLDSEERMPEINWTDTAEIAVKLLEAHPDVDPLSVRFTDLHRWVMEIPGFAGDAKESNEKKLEAIQMAWYEEWQEENG